MQRRTDTPQTGDRGEPEPLQARNRRAMLVPCRLPQPIALPPSPI